MGSSSMKFTTVVFASLLLSLVFLDLPTEVKGGECKVLIERCDYPGDCPEHCSILTGTKFIKGQCEAAPKDMPRTMAVCYCYFTCDKTAKETM